jgi:sensor histidine kinase YesM
LRGRLAAIKINNDELLFSIGMHLYSYKNKTLTPLTTLRSDVINLFEDDKKNVWACTMKGLYKFSKQGNYVEYELLLAEKYISNIFKDCENGYWITTLDDGIYYLVNTDVANYFNNDKLISPLCLTADKSSIYASYFSGTIAKINTTKQELITTDSSGKYIDCIYYDDSNERLYVGSNTIHYIKGSRNYWLKGNRTSCRSNFVKNKNGLFSIENICVIQLNNDSVVREKYISTRLNCIFAAPNNELWVGCIDGVYKFDLTTKKYTIVHKQLKDIRVDAIKLFGEYICFATQGKGLLIMSKDSTFKTIDQSNGLCSNNINKFCVRGNSIWCASFNGISKITFSNINRFNYTITNISTNEGLLNKEVNDITILNDTVWVASKKGISFFNVNTDFINHKTPSVYFTSLQINSKDTVLHSDYQLNYTYNNINIGFESPLFKSDAKQTYQYILVNGKDSIKGITINRNVQFLSLQQGVYSLFVKAKNNSGVWSKNAATFCFTILPAWYNTLWFRLLALVITISIGFVFYKSRLTKIKAKYEIEKQQATLQLTAMRSQMNPHFIFNVMNSIRSYMLNKDVASAEKYLTSFAKLVRYTLDNSTVQEVSLEEELNAVKNYAMLEMQRVTNGFDFDVVIPEEIDLDEIALPSLLLQPFIENAIKHGIEHLNVKGRIILEIKKEFDKIIVIIEDNGIGKTKASEWNNAHRVNHTSHGTKLTLDRIQAYNKAYNKNIQVLSIDISEQNQGKHGTRVEITI